MKANLFSSKRKIFVRNFYSRFLVLGFLALSGFLNAQTVAVTSDVGTGTTYNLSTEYPAPYGYYFWSSHHQLFISPAEIAAAGVAPGGTITSFGFNVFGKNSQTILYNFALTVYTTNLTNPLATAFITGGQVSSTGAAANLTAVLGWNTHTVAPFVWNGTDGIVIETCHSSPAGYTQNASMYWTNNLTGSSVKTRWGTEDAVVNTCTADADVSSTTTRQNVRIGWEGINCTSVPSASVVSNYTNLCAGAAANIVLPTGTYTNPGYSYQWESSGSIGGGYAAIPGATNTALNTGTLSNTQAYRIVVTCTNGPVVGNSTPVLVNVGAPIISDATAFLPLICPGGTGTVALNYDYSAVGVSYQWQTSTVNIVGPYFDGNAGATAATSGTTALYIAPNLTTTTYFHAIVSCTAAPSLSTITNPITVDIEGLTVNNIPYLENFDAILLNNRLPNCSWAASNPTNICQTYTQAATLNRIPFSGSGFASFKSGTNPNGDYFYSNGIQMEPGITYSAALKYITDGGIGWTGLSIWVGTSQSVASLTNIVSANASIIANTFYKDLSNTFTVDASGIYYIAVKAIGVGAQYLSWDDLEITAPCSANAPMVTVSGPTVVCSGQPFTHQALGADTYAWSNGSTGASANITLSGNANVIVVGTNAASGCTTSVVTPVTVNQSPPIAINVVSNNTNTFVCKGSSINLAASGAGQNGNYSWSTGTTAVMISISPTVATTYTVVGTNVNGCSAQAVQQISVKNPPLVNALSSAVAICTGFDSATLTATGANNYTWTSTSSYNVGTQIVVAPFVTTTYTVFGSDANKCEGTTTVNVIVSSCVGLNEAGKSADAISLYPNPNTGVFTLEFSNENSKSIEVLDMTGRLVLATTSSEIKTNVNISQLSAGIYYVKVRDAKNVSVLKIVKE